MFGDAALSGDPTNTQYLIGGTSTSGMIISLIRLGTKGVFPSEQAIHISSNLYFMISGLICILCIYIFAVSLTKTDSSRFQDLEPEQVQDVARGEGTALLSPMNIYSPDSSNKAYQRMIDIISKIWQPLVGNTICYWVTLSIFPGVLVEDLKFSENSWYPIVLITIFNAADCIGKFCPSSIQRIFFNGKSVLLLALGRCIFIPLYLAAMGSIPAISVLTILLGITNGALTTINMVYATVLVESKEQKLCGNINVLFLVLGLNVGAFSGFLWLL